MNDKYGKTISNGDIVIHQKNKNTSKQVGIMFNKKTKFKLFIYFPEKYFWKEKIGKLEIIGTVFDDLKLLGEENALK